MPEYAWMYLNKTGFWIYLEPWKRQSSKFASLTQRFKYARVWLDRVLNTTLVLDMSGFWIWQGSEYGTVTQCSKFTMIDRVLNMYHTIHSARSFCKLMSTYWEMGVLRAISKI